ncbi:Enterobactin outer-membrane receptor [Weeksella virosa]|uniref:SusC/RagA family TonB-linked outer membrane protein n=1 Tax=Weeksella virosa TaxID=1014 RepID=UPI000E05422E|nr:SusC/RagA family TonB-linked outer membrane protein [Weeksella virosa]SUP53513.1 Enterobactin outer-membrane receptor [Weeksella virosa]
MRRNLRSLFFVGSFIVSSALFAQVKTVTGTVTDKDGFPVVDAVVKSSAGAEVYTDEHGKFSIEANEGETITVESFGLPMQTFVVGNSTSYAVSLKPVQTEAIELEGAVVTALGITREKRSLGYATQEISGDVVNQSPVSNFADALSGEIAGLDIKGSGSRGGSTNMVIRGTSTLIGDNQALIVVDGVPINNSTLNTAGQQTGRGGFDYANAAADINPNDIETINVLKGAAAAALYGSRGMNGVVMITTKKGTKKRGIGAEFNSSITVGTVDKSTLPEYQKQYGAGYTNNGSSPVNPYFNAGPAGSNPSDLYVMYGDDASYGAAFDPNLMVYQWTAFWEGMPTFGQKTPWVAAKNDPNTIWKSITTFQNSASFFGSNDEGNFRVGFTNFQDEFGLVNSKLLRNSIDFTGSYNITDRLTVSAKMNFVDNSAKGRVGTGYDGWNPMQQFRQWWQVNVDLEDLRKAYWLKKENATWNLASIDPANSSYLKPLYSDNYFFTRYENFQNDDRKRYNGGVTVNYELTDWLSVLGRYGFDNYTEKREERLAIGSAGSPGSYTIRNFDVSEGNYDVIFNVNKNLTDDLNLNADLGWNLRVQNYEAFAAQTNGGLKIPRLYSLLNSVNPLTVADVSQSRYKKMVDGEYLRASLGYRNMLFLEGSIRTDRSSSLWSQSTNGNRYWYPSGSLSFVFSELMKSSAVNFGKIRLNYAQVGNDTAPYRLWNTYDVNASFGSVGSASNPSANRYANLKPEIMEEYEVGLEMGFFRNRVNFDVSYYNRKTYDLITDVDVSTSTGASRQWTNMGDIKNEGIEVRLGLEPIRTADFSWKMTVNFAKNQNEMLRFNGDIEYYQLAAVQGGVTIGAQIGEAVGIIRGRGYTYDDAGNRIVDANGYYVLSPSTTILGNMNPDWTGGVKNTFTYKNLSLGFLIDVQKGGDVFSLDTFYGYATGLYNNFTTGLNDLGNPIRNSLQNGGGIILPGVDQNGNPNTIRVDASDGNNNPWGYLGGVREEHIYDASFVKLRNVTLSYDLPEKFLRNTFIQKLSLSAVGRNLWIIHKNVPYADPEAGLSAGNIQGYQSGAHPTYREIGLNLKVQF